MKTQLKDGQGPQRTLSQRCTNDQEAREEALNVSSHRGRATTSTLRSCVAAAVAVSKKTASLVWTWTNWTLGVQLVGRQTVHFGKQSGITTQPATPLHVRPQRTENTSCKHLYTKVHSHVIRGCGINPNVHRRVSGQAERGTFTSWDVTRPRKGRRHHGRGWKTLC